MAERHSAFRGPGRPRKPGQVPPSSTLVPADACGGMTTTEVASYPPVDRVYDQRLPLPPPNELREINYARWEELWQIAQQVPSALYRARIGTIVLRAMGKALGLEQDAAKNGLPVTAPPKEIINTPMWVERMRSLGLAVKIQEPPENPETEAVTRIEEEKKP